MSEFTIDPAILDYFQTIKNFCQLISEEYDSEFDEPMTMEQIQAWEKENDFVLPDQMKSWYLLTSSAYIANGYFEIYEPFVGCYKKDDDVVVFASIIGDGEEAMILRETGEMFSDFDGMRNDFEDFTYFLDKVLIDLEEKAEECLGEDWEAIYDERFGKDDDSSDED